MNEYDVIVIGTGVAAGAGISRLQAAGKKVAVVDQGPLGGTCALRGCEPKKVLVTNAHLAAESRALVGKGMDRGAETNWQELQQFKRTFTDPVPKSTKDTYEASGIDVYEQVARFAEPGVIELGDSGERIRAEQFLIATGARSRDLPVTGAELAATSDDFLDLAQLPASMVFVGGGYISMEFAFLAALSGSRVTILQRGPRMLPQFPASLVDPVVEAGEHYGITFVTGADASKVERRGAGYVVGTADRGEFVTDWVMAAIGRVPNTEALNLEAIGLSPGKRGIETNEHMETSAEGVFAAGDCVATKQLTPIAEMEAAAAAANILKPRSVKVDYDAIPSVVFTHPQMASVGMTADEAREAGRDVSVNSGRLDSWASSRRLGGTVGYYETVADAKTGRILGAHIASPHAGEQINVLTLAIRRGLTADDFRGIPWAYPTFTSDLKSMV